MRAIRAAGMLCSVTTGGYGISAAAAEGMAEAGVQQVSVSVDGVGGRHTMRCCGRAGSWRAAMQSLRHLRAAGLRITANTQINRLSAPELVLLYEDLVSAGCKGWQIGLTVPTGTRRRPPGTACCSRVSCSIFFPVCE